MKLEDFKGRRVLVLGMSERSGLPSALALKKLGAFVKASELKTKEELPEIARKLEQEKIEVEWGKNSVESLNDVDFVVISPGVPPSNLVWKTALLKNIPVISEIEIGFLLSKAIIIATTGSNGKTTVTSLITHLLKTAGFIAESAGNIGKSLTSIAPFIPEFGFISVEVSSFQLKNILMFHPEVAILTNITEDHLDWHPSFDDYKNAKLNIFKNQDSDDFAIINSNFLYLNEVQKKAKSKIIYFGTKKSDYCCYERDDFIYLDWNGKSNKIIKSNEIPVFGEHNKLNIECAILAVFPFLQDIDRIKEGIKTFKPLKHRLQPVLELNGVLYVNDSKGTNVDSTVWALKSFNSPVILIAGGKDKDSDFTPLINIMKKKVKKVLLIGEASEKISKYLNNKIPYEFLGNMQDAVDYAYKIAEKGDVVLLSPACASFDQYNDFEERGNHFINLVENLKYK